MFGLVEIFLSFRIGCKTDGRSLGRRKSGGALCVSRRVVGRKPVQAKSARFVPTDCPSVKKIRAANDERTAQAKSARLVPKDCPSVKRETKLFWRLGLDRISYGRHASCVQVLGSQPTQSRAAEISVGERQMHMWKSVARRTGDLSAQVGRRVICVLLFFDWRSF